MQSTICPICKTSKGFDIAPSFQTNSSGEVTGADLSVKCKNPECGKEFPIIKSTLYEHIDTITKFIMDIRNKEN